MSGRAVKEEPTTRTASRHRVLQAVAAGLLAVAMVAAGRETAGAHSFLVRTEPADGASLAGSPPTARIEFSEPVLVDLGTVEVVDQDGRSMAVTLVRGQPSAELIIRLPPLTAGVYRLSWATVSSGDLHPISGSIVFGVDRAAQAAGAVDGASGPSLVEAALRVLNVVAFTAVTGALTIAALVGRAGRGRGRATARQARRLVDRLIAVAAWSGLVALCAGPGLLIAQVGGSPVLAGPSWDVVATLTAPMVVRTVVLGMLLALIFGHRRRRRTADRGRAERSMSTRAIVAVGLGVGAVAMLDTWGSHAAAGDAGWLGMLTGAAHLAGAAVWAGGLGLLALVVLPTAWRSAAGRRLGVVVLRSFSWVAASAVLITVVTGLALAARTVSSLDALLATLYGQLLTAKVQVVSIAALLGFANAAALHGRLRGLLENRVRPGWMTRLIPIEAGAVLVVVTIGAVVAATPPANGPEFRPAAADLLAPSYAEVADDLLVQVAIRPGRSGPNFVNLAVVATRRPALIPIEQVSVRLVSADGAAPPAERTAEARGGGTYEVAGLMLPRAGVWHVEVVVQRHGLPPTSVSTEWVIKPPIPDVARHLTVLSDAPLAMVLQPAAALLAAVGVLGLAALAVRRRLIRQRRANRDPGSPAFLRPAFEEASR